jgi:hypothetical protein
MVSDDAISYAKAKYGEDSDAFRMGILGLPPRVESDALIPWNWIQDAVDHDFEPHKDDPIVIGVDVGGGGDPTVLCVRKGMKIMTFKENEDPDHTKIKDWVFEIVQEYDPVMIYIDSNGNGHGLTDFLRQSLNDGRVRGVKSHEKSSNPRWGSKKDEIMYRLREYFQDGVISIPDHHRLKMELSIQKEDDREDGKARVAKKKSLAKELKDKTGYKSSDYLDALWISFYHRHSILVAHADIRTNSRDLFENNYRRNRVRGRLAWMSH